jgi:hypothetical protein
MKRAERAGRMMMMMMMMMDKVDEMKNLYMAVTNLLVIGVVVTLKARNQP